MDLLIYGGLLLLGFILIVGVLISLQVWLARKPNFIYGLIQPLLWAALAVFGKVYTPSTPDPVLEPGTYGLGAILLAVVSLLVFAIARLVARRKRS